MTLGDTVLFSNFDSAMTDMENREETQRSVRLRMEHWKLMRQ